jgi:putative addiction module killer protein
MVEIRKTRRFSEWFDALRDRQAKLRIQVRIDRLTSGNPSQHRLLTNGVAELKID